MNENQVGNEAQQGAAQAQEMGKKVGQKAGQLAGKAGKKAGRSLLKAGKKAAGKAMQAVGKALLALLKLIISLIHIILPVALVVICGALIVGAIFDWNNEERGSSAALDQHKDSSNVTVMNDEGQQVTIALSKSQAYISAYYKYMACNSYQKTADGENIHTFRGNTEEFAGLEDYYQKENFFYLNPNFIKMADEHLHDGKYFYPEQIVKPISYEVTDGKVTQKPICDEEGALQAESYIWEDDISGEQKNAVHSQTEKEYGVWDYGLGSVLQYGSYEKQRYIDCTYTSFKYDVDVLVKTRDGSYWVHSHVGTYYLPDTTGMDPTAAAARCRDNVQAFYDYMNEDDEIWVRGPSSKQIYDLVLEQHHINMWLEGEDIAIGARSFDAVDLADFSNSTPKYPINIPLIESAATFSGNISYSYTNYTEEGKIYDVTDSMSEAEITDTAQPINRVKVGTCGCSNRTVFWVSRVGKTMTITPTQSDEVDEPVGSQYLTEYCNAYRTYLPAYIADDYDFTKRIETNEEDKKLLKNLGLLVPYSGVESTGPDYNVFAPTGLSRAEFDRLIQYTNLRGCGQILVDFENTYGVSGLFCLAVANTESSYLRASNAQAKNNPFGMLSNGRLIKYASLEEAFSAFGRMMTKKACFINKSIDEISRSYCPPTATEWSKSVKTTMTTLISQSSAFDFDILSVPMGYAYASIGGVDDMDPEIIRKALDESPYADDELYQNVNFDVLKATGLLQQIAKPDEDANGHVTWFEKVFNNLTEMISNFFKSMDKIFQDSESEYHGERIEYGTPISQIDIDDIVYQAMTFSSGVRYTTAYQQVDHENLGFLFVGKEGAFGAGTGFATITMVPGVGTTIDGFISPTKNHYQAMGGWSQAKGGIELAVPLSTDILSIADNGTVKSVNSSAGRYTVVIEYKVNGSTYTATFGNLADVCVAQGRKVNSGDKIGVSGTNLSLQNSLFFGFVDSSGQNVDPLSYFYQPVASNEAIVKVALSQVGNKGGMIYKQWYPLHASDAWCACFVSWCANQCGYISNNTFPKFASCGDGINRVFKPNNIYWSMANGSFQPVPGNIIFFDWIEKETGRPDGVQDHVGIVESYYNGVVYTIEGNSSNQVRRRTYKANDIEIYGYAFPDFVTKLRM